MNINLKNSKGIKCLFFFFYVLNILTCGNLFSQTKVIKGRVISEHFDTLTGVTIMINDTVNVGSTDLNGFFQIEIPVSKKSISFRYIGMEAIDVEIIDSCFFVDVIMMPIYSYDFITLKRADRKRKRRFKKLPELHKEAFEKGIFETEYACYKREFELFYLQEN